MKKWFVRAAAAVFILVFFYFLLACGKKKRSSSWSRSSGANPGTGPGRGDHRARTGDQGQVDHPRHRLRRLFQGRRRREGRCPFIQNHSNPTPLDYVETAAAWEVAEVTMKKLRSDWERQLEMFKGKMISKADMDAVESSYQQANCSIRSPGTAGAPGEGRIAWPTWNTTRSSRPRPTASSSPRASSRGPVVPLTNYQPGHRAVLPGRHGQPALQGHGG